MQMQQLQQMQHGTDVRFDRLCRFPALLKRALEGPAAWPGMARLPGSAERLDTMMGTVATQKAYGLRAVQATTAALREMERLERMLSVFIPQSDIARVNEAAGREPVQVSKETFGILQTARALSEISEGAFDATVGPLARLWSVTADNPRVPSHDDIQEKHSLVDYHKIELDEAGYTCRLTKPGQALDLGGIAKGYAADRAMQIFTQHGLSGGFIDIGGNVSVMGQRSGGGAWAIGIQDPWKERGNILGVLRVTGTSVVTSGDYERGFSAEDPDATEKSQKWYHHIIDPRTGYPSESDVKSVTVVAPRSILADALSTAMFVLGSEEGYFLLQMVQRIAHADAIIVTRDHQVIVTEGLRGCFTRVE